MNERIQKLAEKAGFQYIKDERIGWAGNYNSSLPKFAELIVRECANRIDYWESRQGEHSDDLLKHFGVEG